MGCVLKPVWWTNDSGFWVLSQMIGMMEVKGLKWPTALTLIMEVVGVLRTMLLATETRRRRGKRDVRSPLVQFILLNLALEPGQVPQRFPKLEISDLFLLK